MILVVFISISTLISFSIFFASIMVKSIAGGKYKLGNVIAAGSFGKVYEDAPFAIK